MLSRSSTPLLLLTLTILSYTDAQFDHDSCRSLLPRNSPSSARMVNNDPHAAHGHHRRRAADVDSAAEIEDDGEQSLETDYVLKPSLDNGPGPYRLGLEVVNYRRNRPLKVSIEGPELNSFILQARSNDPRLKHQPVGKFENIPANAQTMDCENSHDTVINKDTGGKEKLEFTWRPPAVESGVITFIATVVQKETYWMSIYSRNLSFNPYPPSLDKCGIDESCYRQSSVPNCEPEDCDYVVIAKITEQNEIKFIVGGTIKEDSGYIGIGFTMDNVKLTHMDITACVKNNTLIDVQQFLVEDWPSGARHENQEVILDQTDHDGNMIWCEFRRSLHGIGSHMADLTQPLFQTFIMGPINQTTLTPILPALENVTFVSEPWNHNNPVMVMHLISHDAASEETVTNIVTVVATSLMALFLTRF